MGSGLQEGFYQSIDHVLAKNGKLRPAPSLFEEIAALYGVLVPIYYTESVFLGDADGQLITDHQTLFPRTILIADDKKGTRSFKGKLLNAHNGRLYTLLHEIMHCLEGGQFYSYNPEINYYKLRDSSRAEICFITKTILENVVDGTADDEYRRIRSFIKRDKYEWKDSNKPVIKPVALERRIRSKLNDSLEYLR